MATQQNNNLDDYAIPKQIPDEAVTSDQFGELPVLAQKSNKTAESNPDQSQTSSIVDDKGDGFVTPEEAPSINLDMQPQAVEVIADRPSSADVSNLNQVETTSNNSESDLLSKQDSKELIKDSGSVPQKTSQVKQQVADKQGPLAIEAERKENATAQVSPVVSQTPQVGNHTQRSTQVMPNMSTTNPQVVYAPTSEIEEVNILNRKLSESQLPEELREKGLGMVKRLEKMAKYGSFSKEFESVEKYISTITGIPWGSYTTDKLDLDNVKAQLDKTHYGVENIKERMLEYIAMLNLRLQKDARRAQEQVGGSGEMARLQGSSSHAPILCLVGIQGIGKTSIAKSIAVALGRKFVRISLGGLAGVSELRGRSRGEADAEPGQVIKALMRTGVMNPMILMDEIDKISESSRADVMAALLEVLDPEQNSTFRDNFIDYPVDLSNVIFVATANNLGGISAALLDRMEVVRMISYNDDEKMHIARDYLLPKVLDSSGLEKDQIVFDDEVWPLVIRPLGFDAGIRELERTLTRLVRKVAMQVVRGEGTNFKITPENFRQYIPEDIGVMS